MRPMAAKAASTGAPEQLALGLVLGHAEVDRARAPAQLHDLLEPGDAFLAGAVQLDEQRGPGIPAVAGAGGLLGGLDRELVHHLDRAGNQSRLDDARDGIAGRSGVLEEGHHRPRCLRSRNHPEPDLGGHAERALGADEGPEQVIARVVTVQMNHRAVAEHDLEPDHVVGGEAVLEAMGAA